MSIVFIITRHVNSEQSNELWQENIRCIRRWYPTDPILIIDDHSNPAFLSSLDTNNHNANIQIIASEFTPGSGEMLAYYYYHRLKLADTAILLHDSFWIQTPIPNLEKIRENSYFTTKFLLSFDRFHENFQQETDYLRQLKNPEPLVWWYHQTELCRYGCQGIQTIISHRFLLEMQEKHHILDLLPLVKTRVDRMCMERVFAAVAMYLSPDLLDRNQVSIYGDFFRDYLQKYEYTTYEYFLANREKIEQDGRAFIKIFSGR